MDIEYYSLDHPSKGKRLFKHDIRNNTVVQVVIHSGEKKTGRPNMKGVYRISEATLTSNYLWNYKKGGGYGIKKTTRRLFECYAHKVVEELIGESV